MVRRTYSKWYRLYSELGARRRWRRVRPAVSGARGGGGYTTASSARMAHSAADLTALLCTAAVSATVGAALMRCTVGASPQPPASRCPAKAGTRQQESTGRPRRVSTNEPSAAVAQASAVVEPDVEIEYCTVRGHCHQVPLSIPRLFIIWIHCVALIVLQNVAMGCGDGVHVNVGVQVEPQGGVDGARVRGCFHCPFALCRPSTATSCTACMRSRLRAECRGCLFRVTGF